MEFVAVESFTHLGQPFKKLIQCNISQAVKQCSTSDVLCKTM